MAEQHGQVVNLIKEFFYLDAPQGSPYDVPEDKEYILYYAPLSQNG